MPKPIEISDVKTLEDLSDLYEQRDVDGDGKLSFEEVSFAEIEEGDVEMGGNRDGYLSPWEVMQMRGFDASLIAETIFANEIRGEAFNQRGFYWNGRRNLRHFPEGTEIEGVRYAAGNEVHYHMNGNVFEAKLADDFSIPLGDGKSIESGDHVAFTPDGQLIYGSKKCFKEIFPDKEIIGTSDEWHLEHVIRVLGTMTPKMLASVKRIRFAYKREAPRLGLEKNPQGAAMARCSRNEMIFWKDYVDEDDFWWAWGDIYHEAAHLRECAIESRAFTNSWWWATGRVYGKYDEPEGEDTVRRRWISDKSHGPRYGCARPYGCWNRSEDIATLIELAVTPGNVFRKLIDPTSHYYLENPDQRPYAENYRYKLRLLWDYGFISKEEYAEIKNVPMEFEDDASLEAVVDAILKYDSEGKYSPMILKYACMRAKDPELANEFFKKLLDFGKFGKVQGIMRYVLWDETPEKRDMLTETLTDYVSEYNGEKPIPQKLIKTMLRAVNSV
jgi:hypothetical protein